MTNGTFKRRHFLQALGLGALTSGIARSSFGRVRDPLLVTADGGADGDGGAAAPGPKRIVFYVQPHGHIPLAWNMDIPGGPTDQFAQRSLLDLQQSDLSPTLQPLYAFRDRLLVIEGLSHTSALADIALVQASGMGDFNNHQIAVADCMTGSRALQQQGTYCTGGARTLDQVLATRLAVPGRFDSRVYGFNYVPNSVVSPFSYLGAGQATPMVSDPAAAFSDLLGLTAPLATAGAPTTRDALIGSMRTSVLDVVGAEYGQLAPRLGQEGRQKLDQHRALIRELELSLTAAGSAPVCNGTFTAASDGTMGTSVRQFMQLIQLAFACDLTRVVTVSAPVPQCPELGYPADATFHGYAHQSILGNTSCGQMYSTYAAQAMTDLDAWHAGHFNYLLQLLDSVPEGSGTMLDNTAVVWVPELATPTHQHFDICTLIAGGCDGFFDTGRYVRYPRNQTSPLAGAPATGPAHNRLHVSLLQAMGQSDTTFGMTGATGRDGSQLSFTGPLTELQTS